MTKSISDISHEVGFRMMETGRVTHIKNIVRSLDELGYLNRDAELPLERSKSTRKAVCPYDHEELKQEWTHCTFCNEPLSS